jgi:acyl-coenzyme A synthetase/AMP-(fatty) acid ligase
MSELSPLALLNPLDAPRDGSCGLAVPNTTFKIVDVSTGKNLEPKKEGEICCKGPMVIIHNMIRQIISNVFIKNIIYTNLRVIKKYYTYNIIVIR